MPQTQTLLHKGYNKMRYLIFAGAALFLVAAYFFVSYLCFVTAAKRGKKSNADAIFSSHAFDSYRAALTESLAYAKSLPYEDAYISSSDGLRLHARVIRAENARAAVLLFHGYRSDGYFDFSAIIGKYIGKGISILLADERSHGTSEGKYIGFGIKERHDCVLWAKEAVKIFPGLPLLIEGLSMGATTVLMASGDDLPPQVTGIIADCGFTSPAAILAKVIRADYHIPPALILPAMNFWFRLLAKYDINEYSTSKALAKCRLPVLFIHGKADGFVPYEMSEENFAAAAGDKTFVSVEKAGHGMSYLCEKEKCDAALDAFIKKTLDI